MDIRDLLAHPGSPIGVHRADDQVGGYPLFSPLARTPKQVHVRNLWLTLPIGRLVIRDSYPPKAQALEDGAACDWVSPNCALLCPLCCGQPLRGYHINEEPRDPAPSLLVQLLETGPVQGPGEPPAPGGKPNRHEARKTSVRSAEVMEDCTAYHLLPPLRQ